MRVYVDTSVFGGVFDEEFTGPSNVFFSQAEEGAFEIVVSIVHQQKIIQYNYINMVNGYPALQIYSPMEVIRYEED